MLLWVLWKCFFFFFFLAQLHMYTVHMQDILNS